MSRVKIGKNDLYTWCMNHGDFGKKLLSEWTGLLEDRSKIDIKDITFGSNKYMYWKCDKNHYWLETLNSRTNQLNGCPFCSGKRVLAGFNDLETWCLNNNMSHLIDEWVGMDAEGNSLYMHQLSHGMKTKVKWKCKYGHIWVASILNRTQHKSMCPICDKNGISGINDLYTWCINNKERGDTILSEWTGLDVEDNTVDIHHIKPKSNKEMQWRCKLGHEWCTSIAHRTLHATNCPYCNNRMIKRGFNDLYTICKNNVLIEHLISEWVGLDEYNNSISMEDLTYGSGVKVQWRCKNKHLWIASISSRVICGTGCPHCNSVSTSYPEQFLYHALKQIYPDAESRCKVLKSKDHPQGIEFDIGIPSIKTCIEYSPTYWHKTRQASDRLKADICSRYNVRLIQIIEDSDNILEHIVKDNYICFNMEQHNKYTCISNVLNNLLYMLGHSIDDVDLIKANMDANNYLNIIGYMC